MDTRQAECLIAPRTFPNPHQLGAFDLLLDEWSDYIFRYDHVLDDARLRQALQAAVDRYPHMAGRKVANGDCVFVQNFTGLALQSCTSAEPHSRDLDLLNPETHGFLHGTRGRRRHRGSAISTKVALLQIKHTVCPNGSVLGISVWHALADFASVTRFVGALTRAYRGEPASAFSPNAASMPPCSDGPDEFPGTISRIAPEHRQAFSEGFTYRKFPLHPGQVAELTARANAQRCRWTDLLFAIAWKELGPAVHARPGARHELCAIVSVENLVPSSGVPSNLLVHPRVQVDKTAFGDTPVEELARRIRAAHSWGVLKELKRFGAMRAWMDRTINRLNQREYSLTPLYESIYGSTVLCNNFCDLDQALFDFGAGTPHWTDFPLDAGLRLLALSPFGSGPAACTLTVALFESEMAQFEGRFTARLADLGKYEERK